MKMDNGSEIVSLVAIGEFGFSEEVLKDGCTVGIHLTVIPATDGREPRIDLLAWKQMSCFRLRAAISNLRRLDDCWAVVGEAFFKRGSFSPSPEFLEKASAVISACRAASATRMSGLSERRATIDFCNDLGIALPDLEVINL